MQRGLLVVALATAAAACSGGGDGATPVESTSTVMPAPTTTVAAETSTSSSSPTTTVAPPPPTTLEDLETQIRADFDATIEARQRCGRDPARCDVQAITVAGSEYEAFLSDLMQKRVENGLATRGIGEYRYRVDAVDVHSPTEASLTACAFDTVVLFDIRDPNNPEDDVVFDESAVGAITTWKLALEEGSWQWVSASVVSESIGQDICDFD